MVKVTISMELDKWFTVLGMMRHAINGIENKDEKEPLEEIIEEIQSSIKESGR